MWLPGGIGPRGAAEGERECGLVVSLSLIDVLSLFLLSDFSIRLKVPGRAPRGVDGREPL